MKQYRSLFRNRNFVLLWLGHAISNVGDFFNSLALVKILSEDAAHLGLYMALVMVAKLVPGVVLAPVAGVVADRVSRKAILVVTDILRAGLVLGLVFTENPAAIITLAFLSSCVSAFFNPASSALLPSLITQEELVSAGSLSVMTQRMASLLGNGIGAAALILLGAHNVFFIDSVSFMVSALLTAGLVVPAMAPKVAGAAKGFWQSFTADVKEALQFIRQSPSLRKLLNCFAIANIGDSAINVLMITFFTVELGLAAEKMGFVWAGFGATSVIGALVIGAVGGRVHWRHLVVWGATYVWAMMAAALVAKDVITSSAFLALLGLGSGAINVGAQAAIAVLVPDQVRGRVFSGWGMVNNLIFVAGVLSAGALSDLFSPSSVMLVYTLSYLACGIYAYFAFRTMGTVAHAAAASD